VGEVCEGVSGSEVRSGKTFTAEDTRAYGVVPLLELLNKKSEIPFS
jgi:hypothetical protein